MQELEAGRYMVKEWEGVGDEPPKRGGGARRGADETEREVGRNGLEEKWLRVENAAPLAPNDGPSIVDKLEVHVTRKEAEGCRAGSRRKSSMEIARL